MAVRFPTRTPWTNGNCGSRRGAWPRKRGCAFAAEKAGARGFRGAFAGGSGQFPLTEDHNYWVDGIATHYIFPLFDELGRRMIKGGILNKKRSEIKYLGLNEIILWGFGVRQPLRARVVERQREFNRRLKLSPPDFLGAFCRRGGISERQGWSVVPWGGRRPGIRVAGGGGNPDRGQED